MERSKAAATVRRTYRIRRKVVTVWRRVFSVRDERGEMVAYVRERTFSTREELSLYSDRRRECLLLQIKASSGTGVASGYEFLSADGEILMRMFPERGGWGFMHGADVYLGSMHARPFGGYEIRDNDGALVATVKTRHLAIAVTYILRVHAERPPMDDVLMIALGSLIGAMDGRRSL